MNQPEQQPPARGQLSSHEATQLVQQLTALSQAQLPLAPGLRAAAAESSSRRLAKALRTIAAELESGAEVEHVLSDANPRLAPHVQGAVRAGLAAGTLPVVLTELVQFDHRSRQLWREIMLALSYPLLLILLTAGLFVMCAVLIIPQFQDIYRDTEMQMPLTTQVLITFSVAISTLLTSLRETLVGNLVVLILVLLVLYRPVWRWIRWLAPAGADGMRPNTAGSFCRAWAWPSRLLSTAPLLGPLFLWHGVAQWTRLLAILLDGRVPLPRALSLTSAGVENANVSDLAAQLSDGARQGIELPELVAASPWLPASLVPILRWGQHSGQLPSALRTAAEMFEGRISLRATVIKTLVPPLMFVLIAGSALFIVAAIFVPMISWIQMLT